MKAYTPTVASANTSSPVKTNMTPLASTVPAAAKSTPAVNANPHVRVGPPGFGSAPKALGSFVQHEQRQGAVPHMSMKPGKI